MPRWEVEQEDGDMVVCDERTFEAVAAARLTLHGEVYVRSALNPHDAGPTTTLLHPGCTMVVTITGGA